MVTKCKLDVKAVHKWLEFSLKGVRQLQTAAVAWLPRSWKTTGFLVLLSTWKLRSSAVMFFGSLFANAAFDLTTPHEFAVAVSFPFNHKRIVPKNVCHLFKALTNVHALTSLRIAYVPFTAAENPAIIDAIASQIATSSTRSIYPVFRVSLTVIRRFLQVDQVAFAWLLMS